MINFIKTDGPIQVCDIGASPIDKTDFIEELILNTNSKLIGFEPNVNEYKKLDKNNPKKKYYNFGIGDGTEKTLNICRSVGMSSFLEPDINYLKNFHGFEKWSEIIKKIKVKTKKLSDLEDKIDFLKIDVQGYESEIIDNSREKIKECIVIQLETSPTPLYKKEKTFASTNI
jgi:FkbM family methyltransferase